MNARMPICLLVLIALLNGCGDETGQTESGTRNQPTGREAGFEWNVGPRTVFSPDGSASIRLPSGPNDWRLLDVSSGTINDAYPNTLFRLISGPDEQRSCRPPAHRETVPARSSLIQITEGNSVVPAKDLVRIGYPPKPTRFSRWPKPRDPCQPSGIYSFRMWNRAFQAWVWPGRDRDDILPLLNSFEAQLPGAAPFRTPFMALDCRKPPNTIDCDRIFFHLSTRIPMERVAVRIGGPSGRVFRLNPNRGGSGRGVVPRTIWTGFMSRAGLGRPESPLYVDLPAGETRWTGNPRVAPIIEVLAKRRGGPSWVAPFPRTELAAGHG